MEVFVVLDKDDRPVGAAMTEEVAMDILFNRALQEGRVDEAMGTFDQSGDSVLSTDIKTLGEQFLFTQAELDELQENGAVLL